MVDKGLGIIRDEDDTISFRPLVVGGALSHALDRSFGGGGRRHCHKGPRLANPVLTGRDDRCFQIERSNGSLILILPK